LRAASPSCGTDPTVSIGATCDDPIVNAAHPGRAEHRELAGLDHGATRQLSLEAGARNPGGGEQVADLQDAVLEFLQAG
jgi:hypothetical protein